MSAPSRQRIYGAYQKMGRGGFGLGRGGAVGREYGDVGPAGEGGIQAVPWPKRMHATERPIGRGAMGNKSPKTVYALRSKDPR